MGTGVGEQDELEGVGEQDEPSDCHADMSPVEEKGQRKNWVARASDSRAAPRGLLHGTTRVGTRIPSGLVIARAAQKVHPQGPATRSCQLPALLTASRRETHGCHIGFSNISNNISYNFLD